MSNKDYESFQYDLNFDFFADLQNDHYQSFIASQREQRRFQFDQVLPSHDHHQPETGLNEQVHRPIYSQSLQNSPQQTSNQSKKHNFPKNFIHLLKKCLKGLSLTSPIEIKYLQYIQKNIKNSIKSLNQMILPFLQIEAKGKQIKSQFLKQFEQSHPHLTNFSLMDREKKILTINQCRQSIRNEICLKKDSIIQTAKRNKIKDQIRHRQFPKYVTRLLKGLEVNKIRGKDIKQYKKDLG